jgi:hypothetical protein
MSLVTLEQCLGLIEAEKIEGLWVGKGGLPPPGLHSLNQTTKHISEINVVAIQPWAGVNHPPDLETLGLEWLALCLKLIRAYPRSSAAKYSPLHSRTALIKSANNP